MVRFLLNCMQQRNLTILSMEFYLSRLQLYSEIFFAYITHAGTATFLRHYSKSGCPVRSMYCNSNCELTSLFSSGHLCIPPATTLKALMALTWFTLLPAFAPHTLGLQLPLISTFDEDLGGFLVFITLKTQITYVAVQHSVQRSNLFATMIFRGRYLLIF